MKFIMHTMQLMSCKIVGFCELCMAAFTFALQGHCALSVEVTERNLKFSIGNEKVSIASAERQSQHSDHVAGWQGMHTAHVAYLGLVTSRFLLHPALDMSSTFFDI